MGEEGDAVVECIEERSVEQGAAPRAHWALPATIIRMYLMKANDILSPTLPPIHYT